MWIVRLALRRRYTFVVMAILIALLGWTSIVTMSTDIFPNINCQRRTESGQDRGRGGSVCRFHPHPARDDDRAMATDPALILADEPTANLDSATAASLLDIMEQ